MKRIGLAWQILIGLALGIAVGAIFLWQSSSGELFTTNW